MHRVLTIARLTWKAAFRFRLFWVLASLLVAAVVALPLLIKGDGTAQGLTQVLLTYTLTAITGLLGFATLWLACGALARDVEECQIQVIAVKPIARWQIWLGKWLGIVALDAALLALAGGSVFLLLNWRASHLPSDQQAILREQVFVARAGIKPPAQDVTAKAEEMLKEQAKNAKFSQADISQLRQQNIERLKASQQIVPPGYARRWVVDLGLLREFLRGQTLQLRVRFRSPDPNSGATYNAVWQIGPPESRQSAHLEQRLPPDSFQEFNIPANLFDADGKLTIDFFNANDTALLFPVEDGIEVLYHESGFALNFARGLGVILCWLALLAALGLAAASALSFPVAAFCSLAALILSFSGGTLRGAVDQGTIFSVDHETGLGAPTLIDSAIIPLFKGALKVITLVQDFSPVDSLSTGRSITWSQLGLAAAQIVFLLGGICCLVGVYLFTRRELASVQSNS